MSFEHNQLAGAQAAWIIGQRAARCSGGTHIGMTKVARDKVYNDIGEARGSLAWRTRHLAAIPPLAKIVDGADPWLAVRRWPK